MDPHKGHCGNEQEGVPRAGPDTQGPVTLDGGGRCVSSTEASAQLLRTPRYDAKHAQEPRGPVAAAGVVTRAGGETVGPLHTPLLFAVSAGPATRIPSERRPGLRPRTA